MGKLVCEGEKEIGVEGSCCCWLRGEGEFHKETVCGYFGSQLSRNILLAC